MRHLKFCLALAAAALVIFSGTAALAAIADTPHDVSTTLVKSVCEPCHLPHGATGDRLWATTKSSGGGWNSLTISQLCGSCHYGTPAYPGMVGVAHDQTNYAYNTSNHGYQTTNLASRSSFDNAAMGASGLPYVAGASIQCSSCHNPHENTVRPFMRLASGTVESLCLMCHARNNGDGTAAVLGALNNPGASGFSQHPVNIAYASPGSGGNPSLKALDAALFATDRGTAGKGTVSLADALGGKLLNPQGTTGNMGCPTCHQVHGNGTNTTVNAWLLVTANQISTGTPTTSVLCEACHSGGAPGGTVIVGSSKDHPIDNNVTGRAHFDFTPWDSSAAYESQDATWPKIATNRAGCTSCHSAHYGLAGSPMQRSYTQTGGSPFNPTPTADLHNSTAWCESCHTGASKAPFGHHSVKDNYASSLINCGDCHNSGATPADTTIATAQMSAHRNWAALDLPAAAPVSAQRANFCLKCHAGAAFDPLPAGGGTVTIGAETLQAGTFNPTTPVGGATFPAIHGTKRGGAGSNVSSHYLGATTKLAAGDNVTTPRTVAWESGFFSRYATTAGALIGNPTTGSYPSFNASDRIVCESCHNILYNAGSEGNTSNPAVTATAVSGVYNNLLLQRYEDDAAGVAGTGSAFGSLLCVGCHGGGTIAIGTLNLNTHKPGGTHPVTGTTVTKAVDMGVAPYTLITANGARNTYGNAVGAPGIQSYPAADAMDCDSCHRAHDGAAGSVKVGVIGTGYNYILEQATSNADVQSMCTVCHTY
jgi:predicted CXXCH cytochrome family protein